MCETHKRQCVLYSSISVKLRNKMHTGRKAGVKNQTQPLVTTPPLHMYFYFKKLPSPVVTCGIQETANGTGKSTRQSGGSVGY